MFYVNQRVAKTEEGPSYHKVHGHGGWHCWSLVNPNLGGCLSSLGGHVKNQALKRPNKLYDWMPQQ